MPLNLVLSSHRISHAQTCLRYYYYKHELMKGPIKREVYFDEGDILHAMLKMYYTAKMNGTSISDKLIFELGRNFAAQSTEVSSEIVESTIDAMDMYIQHYKGDNDWKILAVEQSFVKILFENEKIRIIATGTPDLVVKTMRGKGPRVLVDHKYEAQFRRKFPRDNQPLTYCWGTGISDFLYNRIGKQKSYKPEQRLVRDPYFSYGKHHIEEWKESTIATCLEIIRCHELDYYPPRLLGCVYMGRKCTFHDVCHTTPNNREYKLNTFFKDEVAYDKDMVPIDFDKLRGEDAEDDSSI